MAISDGWPAFGSIIGRFQEIKRFQIYFREKNRERERRSISCFGNSRKSKTRKFEPRRLSKLMDVIRVEERIKKRAKTNQQIVLLFPNFTPPKDEPGYPSWPRRARNHQCPDNDTAIIFPVFVCPREDGWANYGPLRFWAKSHFVCVCSFVGSVLAHISSGILSVPLPKSQFFASSHFTRSR